MLIHDPIFLGGGGAEWEIDVELKAKIEAFKAERTGKKVDSDPMDTSGD